MHLADAFIQSGYTFVFFFVSMCSLGFVITLHPYIFYFLFPFNFIYSPPAHTIYSIFLYIYNIFIHVYFIYIHIICVVVSNSLYVQTSLAIKLFLTYESAVLGQFALFNLNDTGAVYNDSLCYTYVQQQNKINVLQLSENKKHYYWLNYSFRNYLEFTYQSGYCGEYPGSRSASPWRRHFHTDHRTPTPVRDECCTWLN